MSDTPPVGVPDKSLWIETDTGLMFSLYNDGNSTQWMQVVSAAPAPQGVPGHIWGLTLSTAGSSTTFNVAAGAATDRTNAVSLQLAANTSKTTATWAVGSGSGALDTGTIAASTWYHVFVIRRPNTGVVDVLISLSPTAPTLPANYTQFRRIGAMRTNASSQWTSFVQDGDTFTWFTPVLEFSVTNPGTAAVTRTLTTPLGIRTEALISSGVASTVLGDNPGSVLISDLSLLDIVPGSGTGFTYLGYGAAGLQIGVSVRVFTNTASQVRSRLQVSGANTLFFIITNGWVDRRGRDV
jgi:hypothetical protein